MAWGPSHDEAARDLWTAYYNLIHSSGDGAEALSAAAAAVVNMVDAADVDLEIENPNADHPGRRAERVDEDLPTIEDPDEGRRARALARLGPALVPETGPVPNHYHMAETTLRVTVPQWVIVAAAWRLAHQTDPDRDAALEEIIEHVAYDLELRTVDGVDAIHAVLRRSEDLRRPRADGPGEQRPGPGGR